MNRFIPNRTPCGQTRREFLWQVGGGFAGLALIDLLSEGGFFSRPVRGAEAAAPASARGKAKSCIFLFMNGGPSQVDTFDPKPELKRFHGQPYQGDAKVGSNGRPVGHLMQSPFEFPNMARAGSRSAASSRTQRALPMISASFARCTPIPPRTPRGVCR